MTPDRRRQLPWVTHVVAAVGWFAAMLLDEISTYGLESSGPWSFGAVMSAGILVGAVLLTSPLAVTEAAFVVKFAGR